MFLGYPQYREDGIAKSETGNTIISVPMLATVNPIGSVVAHVSMHFTAVAHSYETPTFLPPETKAGIAATPEDERRERGDGPSAPEDKG